MKELVLKGGTHKLVPAPGRDAEYMRALTAFRRANYRAALARNAMARTQAEQAEAYEALCKLGVRVPILQSDNPART